MMRISSEKATIVLIIVASALVTVRSLSAASPKALDPNTLQRILLRSGGGKRLREKVVKAYFDGVGKQNREQIVSCFNPEGTVIRDVCGVNSGSKLATPDQLGERCMEFLAAHPDTSVFFHYE